MPINQMLLPEFDQEMANTRKILEKVPENNWEYKRHEKWMTLGRLAGHVAEMPQWARETIKRDVLEIDPGQKPFSAKSRQELLDTFDKGVIEARELISNLTDEQIGQTWTLRFSGKDIVAMPRLAVLRGMVMNHMIHHRAQLGVYLRLNNVPVPGMYGP